MLRVVHTSDWHIGQELFGWSRAHEHAAFFDQLAVLLVEREVDALIIAGDVFDHQNASSQSQAMLFEALARFRKVRPTLTTVMVAGNHDAAGRIEAPRALLSAFGVHVVGAVQRRDGKICEDTHAIPLRDATGEIRAWVAALPFLRPVDLPPLHRDEGQGSPIVDAVRTLYAEVSDAVIAMADGLPVILTGHLHVAGGLESEGAERRILIGGEHAAPPEIFPETAAYVALGHLHKPQHVGRETIRYAGAPFPMSATERHYRHGVSLVEIADDGGVSVEHVELVRSVRFVSVPEKGALSVDAAPDALKKLVDGLGVTLETPMHLRPFVQLTLSLKGPHPNLRQDLDLLGETLPVRIVAVRLERDEVEAGPEVEGAQALSDLDPETVFAEAFARAHSITPEPPHFAVFHQAMTEEN